MRLGLNCGSFRSRNTSLSRSEEFGKAQIKHGCETHQGFEGRALLGPFDLPNVVDVVSKTVS